MPGEMGKEVLHNVGPYIRFLETSKERLEATSFTYGYEVLEATYAIDVIDDQLLHSTRELELPSLGISVERRRLKDGQITFLSDVRLGRGAIISTNGRNVASVRGLERVRIGELSPMVGEARADHALDILFENGVHNLGHEDFEVLGAKRKEGYIDLTLFPKGDTIEVRPNVHVLNREINALRALASAGETHLPLAKLLHPEGNGRWDYFSPTRIKDEEFILLNHDSIDGVRYQRAFVETALGTRDIAILDGPPGSGKTTTLVELILQLIGRGKRVLMVASTHVAVDNVLERIEDACSDDNMIDSFGVIPLRIGSEANVSDRAAKYLVRNIVATERERIRAELERIERSEAQEAFYQYLKEDPKRHSALEELVIDTANLVCGTTIGVLQADLIKNSRGEAVFDCLILDEASKTTFQEFIVPAMHARRWILSGDVRQLAPYVDSDPTVANLAAITSVNEGFAPRERRMALAILYAFEYLSRKREPIRIVLDDDLVPKAEAQVKALNHLAKGEYRKIIHRVLGQEGNGAELLLIPRSSGRNGQRMNGRTWDADDLPSTWEEEVEWRIKRMFEMRHEPKGHRRYRSQLRMLLPHYDRKVKEKVESRIEDIRRMTLPSVLELIQSGFERDMGAKSEIPLFNGMPEDDLSRRLITLRYQHRMHPEISSLPAREVYESKALRDPDGIEERRAWSYGRYRSRSAWIDVRPGKRDITNGTSNHNRAEARRVVEEIAAFLHWAPKGRRWSVGVLTPYRSQESMIVEELSRRSSALGLKRTNRSFSSSDVEVEVCTVDRYQGHEADVVLLSMVRAKGMPVGHMDSLNRLNVAITRARYQLVVIGDRENFLRNPRAPELLRALANESAVIRGDGGRS